MNAELLVGWAFSFALVTCRVSALLFTLPLFSEVVPLRLRVALGLMLGGAFTAMLGPFAADGTTTLALLGLAASEVLLGAMIGFGVRVLFGAVEGAGQIAGVQLGLSFAGNVDPLLREEVIVTTRILSACAWLGLVSVNGWAYLLGLVAQSLWSLPLGSLAVHNVDLIIRAVQSAFLMSLQIALPVLLGMLVIQAMLALISRVVAELNPYALSFAAMTLVGLVLFVPAMSNAADYGQQSLQLLQRFVNDLGVVR